VSHGQVEGGPAVSAVERGLDKVGVLLKDGEIELVVEGVMNDEVGLESQHLVLVSQQVVDAKVRLKLVGIQKLLRQAFELVGAVVDLDFSVEVVAGVVADAVDAFGVDFVGLRGQVDVEAAEAVGRGDGDGEGRVEDGGVDVLGLAVDYARALALPVLQGLQVGDLVDHFVLEVLELVGVVDGNLEYAQVYALGGAWKKKRGQIANELKRC